MGDEDNKSNGRESDLEFYFRFVKPLILNLPHAKDRALASGWARKIRNDESGPEKLRTDYLKLLLMALQRNSLVGIFADEPNSYDTLPEFPEQLDLNDFAKKLIEKEFKNRQERIKQQLQGHPDKFPPYITDCSTDMQEYVAVQDIPGFGVHCYYAISKEPIDKWHNAERGIFPKRPKSAGDFGDPSGLKPSGTGPVLCVCPPEEGQEKSECAKKMEPPATEKPKKMRSKKWGSSPPIRPIGASPPKDDRIPPIWGSNLINVFDDTQSDSTSEEEILSLSKELSNLEQFLEQYNEGRLSRKQSSVIKLSTMLKKGKSTDDSGEDADIEGPSQRMEEVQEDSHLVEFFKGKLCRTATHYQAARRNKEVQASTPARAYIPVTTPRSSPIPKRPTGVSKGCSTEETCKSFSANFNNDLESAAVDRELAMWMRRLKELEKECVTISTQTAKQCASIACQK